MLKRLVLMLLLAGLLFGGIAGYKYQQIQTLQRRFAVAPPPTRVAVTTAVTLTWPQSLFAVGSLAAVQDVNVMNEVPGQIAAIHFESGQQVTAGDLLVTLDASIDEAELKGLQATQRLAELQLERATRLEHGRIVSQSQFDEATARRDEVAAQVAAKRAYLAKKLIRAPISGTLGIRRIDLGDYMAPGTQVVTLQTLDPMFVDFRLPERLLPRLARGQAISLGIQSLPERQFEGVITAIDPAVDPATRMVKVRAKLPNPEQLLRPGMFAEVHVKETRSVQVVAVPVIAITYNPYGDAVFLIEQHEGVTRVVRRPVQTGEIRDGLVAITGGLKAGDRVVAVGQNRLRNDLTVEVVPAKDSGQTGS